MYHITCISGIPLSWHLPHIWREWSPFNQAIICYTWASILYSDFLQYHRLLCSKLRSQGFLKNRQMLSIEMFFLKIINKLLKGCGLIETDQCIFYTETKESLLHLFWECTYGKHSLFSLVNVLGNFSLNKRYINSPNIILGMRIL